MDRNDDSRDSWPPTSSSPRPGSLYHATTTVDDLTLALTNYSRVPSPEPPPPLTCCCGSEDCEYTKGWLEFKSKLESRLILSAGVFSCFGRCFVRAEAIGVEVGQALLQKYEAYVRRHEVCMLRLAFVAVSPITCPQSEHRRSYSQDTQVDASVDQVDPRVAELVKENGVLEKVSLPNS
jgi:hypothetical protein